MPVEVVSVEAVVVEETSVELSGGFVVDVDVASIVEVEDSVDDDVCDVVVSLVAFTKVVDEGAMDDAVVVVDSKVALVVVETGVVVVDVVVPFDGAVVDTELDVFVLCAASEVVVAGDVDVVSKKFQCHTINANLNAHHFLLLTGKYRK